MNVSGGLRGHLEISEVFEEVSRLFQDFFWEFPKSLRRGPRNQKAGDPGVLASVPGGLMGYLEDRSVSVSPMRVPRCFRGVPEGLSVSRSLMGHLEI